MLYRRVESIAPEDKKKLVQLAFLCFSLILTLVFYIAFYRGEFDYMLRAYQDLSVKKKLLAIKTENRSSYESNMEQLAMLENELDAHSGEVIAYRDIPVVLEKLTDIMARCHMIETYFNSGGYEQVPVTDIDDVERLYIVGVELIGMGRYQDALAFIDAVNNAETCYRIDSAEFSVEEAPPGKVILRLQLSFYAY